MAQPKPLPPDTPKPSSELGRRVQALHDATARLADLISDCATTPNPKGRLTRLQYRQAFKDLYDSTVFKTLLAEVAAFRGFMRADDPAAHFPTQPIRYEREGDYDLEGKPGQLEDLAALQHYHPPTRPEVRP